MEFKDKLYNIMSKVQITQAELSRKSGIPEASISSYLSGKYKPGNKNIASLSKALGVSVDNLIDWDNNEEPVKEIRIKNIADIDLNDMVKIPHLGSIRAGFDYTPDLYDGEHFEVPAELISRYVKEDLFTLTVDGNSMYPLIMPRDIVLINRGLVVNNGDIAAVWFEEDDTSTIKKFYKDMKNKTITLVAGNPEFPDRVYSFEEAENLGLKVVGKVIKMLNRDF